MNEQRKLFDLFFRWELLRQPIGRVKEPFQIILEVDNNARFPSYFAIDDIRLVDCFPSKHYTIPTILRYFFIKMMECHNKQTT